MDRFNSEDLPPELDELGHRMTEERPVASDRTLDSVMTRAQGARRTRKSSLLWRSNAPRTPRKSIALAFTALALTGGMAASASALDLLGLLGGDDIPLVGNLLGGKASSGNCAAGGLIAVSANVGGDCSSESEGKKGSGAANCSAAGLIAVGANVLGDCSSESEGKKGASAANCSASGLVAVGLNVLGDCSSERASSDAAAVQYSTANCSATGAVALAINLLGDCSSEDED